MSERLQIESIPNIPYIQENDNIGEILVRAAQESGLSFQDNDIVCVASKAVSIAEGRRVRLDSVEASEVAKSIQAQVPRKDARTIQLIIDATGAPDGSRVEVAENYIAGWLPNGLRLTSAGVDKNGTEEVILLPVDADASAKQIGKKILSATNVNVGVIITDSDGRVDKKGATQLAIGVYGVSPLRITEYTDETGSTKRNEETVCDMFAASAALIMGQRGTNKPAVVIRGYEFDFNQEHTIIEAINS